jgi:cystathionine beta-lyase
LLTFELVPCSEEAFSAFIDALTLFGIGTSWGGFESLVMPAVPHSMRSMERLPNAGRLVRLHIGLENPDDLIGDLAQGLSKIA